MAKGNRGGKVSSSGKVAGGASKARKAKTDIDKKAQQIASSYIQRYAKMSDKELDRELTKNSNETRYLKLRLSDLERAERAERNRRTLTEKEETDLESAKARLEVAIEAKEVTKTAILQEMVNRSNKQKQEEAAQERRKNIKVIK